VGAVPLPSDAPALGLIPVGIGPEGEHIAAWYAPARGGGTIVLCGGTGSTRTSLLDEARLLVAGGHGVVLFDWPGHGESTGAVDLGSGAREALRAVLDAVAQLPGVDQSRIGVFAFSYGGVAAVPVVASDVHVRALVVAGTPLDPWQQTAYEYRHAGWFAIRGARWFWSRRGEHFEDMRLAAVASRLAPRPVLVIAGDRDEVVDPADATRLAALIGASATLWRIAGAGHGAYGAASPDYGRRLSDFFAGSLAPLAVPALAR
jgi:putative redox protein